MMSEEEEIRNGSEGKGRYSSEHHGVDWVTCLPFDLFRRSRMSENKSAQGSAQPAGVPTLPMGLNTTDFREILSQYPTIIRLAKEMDLKEDPFSLAPYVSVWNSSIHAVTETP
eukprot:768795-Hanusia_phi.AAC.5